MRLFTAVRPPEEVRASLARALHHHCPSGGAAARRLSWVAAERWHITVAFYGEDDLHRRARWLAARLDEHRRAEPESGPAPSDRCGPHPAVEDPGEHHTGRAAPPAPGSKPGGPQLRLAGAGTFPGVLWAGVCDPSGGLAAIARRVGAQEDRRAYRPHLTLARVRGAEAAAAARAWASALAGYRGPGWRAGELLLMSSEPGAGAARYTVRERYGLAAAIPPPGGG